MNSPDDVTGPINLGNPNEFTILELAQQIIELTGSKSRIEHRELPSDDPKQRKPDTQKAFDLLKWRSSTTLHEGLTKTIQNFESRLLK